MISGISVSVFPGLAELRHQQQDAGEALLAGVEQLVDQIGLCAHARGSARKRSEKLWCSCMTRIISSRSILSAVHAVTAVAVAMRRPGTLAIDSSPMNSPGAIMLMVASLPLSEPTVSFGTTDLQVENGVGRVSLREERLLGAETDELPSQSSAGEEGADIEL